MKLPKQSTRNFVAKHMPKSGVGAHLDKKRRDLYDDRKFIEEELDNESKEQEPEQE